MKQKTIITISIILLAISISIHLFNFFKSDLIHIKIVGNIEEDFKETNASIVSDLVCDLKNRVCGNEVYYNENKGFLWGGFPQNISGINVEAYLQDD